MLKITPLFFTSIFTLIGVFSFSQNTSVLFKSGEFLPEININDEGIAHSYLNYELINGQYFRLIQFDDIPTTEEKNMIKNAGVELLDYLPRNAFFARISINTDIDKLNLYGVLSIHPIDPLFKLAKDLALEIYPSWALSGNNEIDLNAAYFDGVPNDVLTNELKSSGASILHQYSDNSLRIRVNIDDLKQVYSLNSFHYFEAISAEGKPENLVGRTNHRSNSIATDYNTGLKYDGSGVVIMMQDDGYIGEHIDYEGRVDQSGCSGCSWNDNNSHGDHVAGTIMGAGNLNPKYRGMAFGADLLVYSSNNDNYDDVPNLYTNNNLVITSKSYSNGCNDGYTSLARRLDKQIREYPSLMHVFSAGNDGASDCSYGAGAGWGNITGGHKAGKNVITVANLTAGDIINGSSSRGPCEDGRIKPDISGVGTSVTSTVSDYDYDTYTGTSMSCPGVAGTLAQLYQAYKDLNGGANPKSGLMKAAILNTADDLGNPGPDFKYGWGRINARKAYEVLEQNNYIESTISQGANVNHTITVPAGVSELKVMLYWNDYEGASNASPALVNDLNMQVTDPAFVSFSPWVLNSSPNATTLDDDAVPGTDNLNNMEQVTILNPITGTYNIDISGFAIPQGPQEYFLVYEFGRDEVVVTYPIGGEGLNPGDVEFIRWDASEGTAPFDLEYTLDNGAIWNSIGSANADKRYNTWVVPSAVSGLAKVRVSRNAQSDESDEVFTIIQTPENLDFGYACPDSVNLTWDVVPGATGYEVSMLGTKYMDSIGTSIVNNLTVPFLSTDDNWFSVRALGPNNARSERAVAIRKTPGQFNCFWSAPIASISPGCDSIRVDNCVQVFNTSANVDAGSSYMWYFPGGTPATSTDENPIVCYNGTGTFDAALVATNSAGSDSVYISDYVFVQGALGLPYFEGFENLTSFNGLENWSIYNPGGNGTWGIYAGASLGGAKSARLFNFGQSNGSIDELISGPIDLSSLTALDTLTFSFRYSFKKRESNDDDILRLYAKNSCDDDWSIKKTMSANVMTTQVQDLAWIPTDSSHWTTVHVTSITSAFFTNDFRYKFQFEHGGGNYFYLDNINLYQGSPSNEIVSGLDEITEISGFELYPNPAVGELNVGFNLSSNEKVEIRVQDLYGRVIQQHSINGNSGNNLVMLEVSNFSSGVYLLDLSSGGNHVTERFVVK